MFVEGVLWIVRTGSPWRDLPEAFGDWNSVFRRFSRWASRASGQIPYQSVLTLYKLDNRTLRKVRFEAVSAISHNDTFRNIGAGSTIQSAERRDFPELRYLRRNGGFIRAHRVSAVPLPEPEAHLGRFFSV
jgi:Putative transposase of IS4/5 family (DUF4096)